MTIGEKIKTVRKANKLTQPAFASLLGKSVRMVQKYESNEVTPSVEQIERIAKELGTTPFELMGWGYFDVKNPHAKEQFEQDTQFEKYLESLGYTVEHEVSEWHYEEMADDSGEIMGRGQVADDYATTLSKDKETVKFSAVEYEELRSGTRDVIETRFYKKLIETKGKK